MTLVRMDPCGSPLHWGNFFCVDNIGAMVCLITIRIINLINLNFVHSEFAVAFH